METKPSKQNLFFLWSNCFTYIRVSWQLQQKSVALISSFPLLYNTVQRKQYMPLSFDVKNYNWRIYSQFFDAVNVIMPSIYLPSVQGFVSSLRREKIANTAKHFQQMGVWIFVFGLITFAFLLSCFLPASWLGVVWDRGRWKNRL